MDLGNIANGEDAADSPIKGAKSEPLKKWDTSSILPFVLGGTSSWARGAAKRHVLSEC
jgi:hypothetical protein